MKLYATTTSERASKGQGGNEYLLIDIMDEGKNTFLQVHITQAKDHLRGEHKNIYIYNPQAEYIAISQNGFIETKGKSDEDICQRCGYHETRCKCMPKQAPLIIKGKRQKGECEHIKKNGQYFTGKCPICDN